MDHPDSDTENQTIECPRCQKLNPLGSLQCQLCEELLISDNPEEDGHIVLEPVDASTSSVSLGKVLILLLFAILIVGPWVGIHKVVGTPEDVAAARRRYSTLLADYQRDPHRWNMLKDQVLQTMKAHRDIDDISKEASPFNGLPLQALVAFSIEELGIGAHPESGAWIYPISLGENPRLLLAKPDKVVGVWNSCASIEIALEKVDGQLKAHPVRLRKGSKELPVGLAWSYFGEEMGKLRKLESFQGGIQRFSIYSTADQTDPTKLKSSWVYRHPVLL